MGIHDFSKVFEADEVIEMKHLKNKKVGIDAETEIYRASLGAPRIDMLTDKFGNPTLPIKVILSNILTLAKNNVDMIWGFGNKVVEPGLKADTLAKRSTRKQQALEKINNIKLKTSSIDDEVNGDDNDQDNGEGKSKSSKSKSDKPSKEKPSKEKPSKEKPSKEKPKKVYDDSHLKQLEKQTFSLSQSLVNDVKKMFDFFNIKYVDAPLGFEGEACLSYLCMTGVVDGVLSGDVDPIPFGAPVLYRVTKKAIGKAVAKKKVLEIYKIPSIIKQIAKHNKNKTKKSKKSKKNTKSKKSKKSRVKSIKIEIKKKSSRKVDSDSSDSSDDSDNSDDSDSSDDSDDSDSDNSDTSSNDSDSSSDDSSDDDSSSESKVDLDTIRKICMILGSDFAPKTPKVGAKTVLDKYQAITLTPAQLAGLEEFKKIPPPNSINIVNKDKKQFHNYDKAGFVKWITEEKSFKLDAVKKQLESL